jgi:hypothetical protein
MSSGYVKPQSGWINWRGSVFVDVSLRQTPRGVLVFGGLPFGKMRLKQCELRETAHGYAIRGVRIVPGGVRLIEEMTFFPRQLRRPSEANVQSSSGDLLNEEGLLASASAATAGGGQKVIFHTCMD